MSWYPQANDSWVYVNYAYNGHPKIPTGVAGIAWNCNLSSICVASNSAMNMWWSDIYINAHVIYFYDYVTKRQVFMHEMGHTLGLYHHSPSGEALMGTNQMIQAPDIGYFPLCGASTSYWGIRCIYNWSYTGNKFFPYY